MTVFVNRAGMTSVTTGTGSPLTLGTALGAVAPNVCSFLDLSGAGVTDAQVVSYLILDSNGGWEAGTGTYTAAGTTLTRAVTKSSNSDNPINLSGNQQVFVTARAEDLLSITTTQTANRSFAGPASGGAAAPTFRALVSADMPATIGFSAHKNGTNQTGIADATSTLLTWSTEIYDVGGYFASNTWTPPAGKVSMSLFFQGTGTIAIAGGVAAAIINKNGATFASSSSVEGINFAGAIITVDDIANGTDAYTALAYMDIDSGTATVTGTATLTRFTGHWIGP